MSASTPSVAQFSNDFTSVIWERPKSGNEKLPSGLRERHHVEYLCGFFSADQLVFLHCSVTKEAVWRLGPGYQGCPIGDIERNACPQRNGLAWKQESYRPLSQMATYLLLQLGITRFRVLHPQRLANSSQRVCLPPVGIVKLSMFTR